MTVEGEHLIEEEAEEEAPVSKFITLFQYVKTNNIEDVYSQEIDMKLDACAVSIMQEPDMEEILTMLRYICKNLKYKT